MTTLISRIGLVCCAVALCVVTATAQYALPRSVFGVGGMDIGGPGNRINGTLGQTAAGIATIATQRNYIGFWWTITPITIGVDRAPDVPDAIHLAQNYPNPFRERTTITFRIGARSAVRLSVHDMLGRELALLTDGVLDAGTYTATFGSSAMHGSDHAMIAPNDAMFPPAAGMYIIRLLAGSQLRSVTCTVLR